MMPDIFTPPAMPENEKRAMQLAYPRWLAQEENRAAREWPRARLVPITGETATGWVYTNLDGDALDCALKMVQNGLKMRLGMTVLNGAISALAAYNRAGYEDFYWENVRVTERQMEALDQLMNELEIIGATCAPDETGTIFNIAPAPALKTLNEKKS